MRHLFTAAPTHKAYKPVSVREIHWAPSALWVPLVSAVWVPLVSAVVLSSVLPPKGLIRHAQGEGVLSANAQDEAGMEQENKDNKELSSAAKQLDKAEEARKAAFAKRKAELAAERAKATA